MNQTNWIPGIIVLVVSALAAAISLVLFRGRRVLRSGPNEALADLDRRAQLLLDQLNELFAEKHQLPPDEFVRRKRELEEEAASALRTRDESRTSTPRQPRAEILPGAEKRTGFWARNPQLKGALWGGGIVLFFVALGVFLSQDQKPRGQGEATGRTPPMSNPSSQPNEDSSLKAAIERIKANPQDVASAALVGHELIRRQQWEEAEKVTERALGVDPFFVENRIHRAVLKVTRGHTDEAIRELEHLANSYPDASEALLFLGGLMMEAQNQRRALEYFERYAAEAPPPDQPPQLRRVIETLRQELGAR